MKFFRVDKVEDLHHDKSVENESVVPGKDSEILVTLFIINRTIDKLHPSTSDVSTNNPIFPLTLRP
jgi:hypothetical protein